NDDFRKISDRLHEIRAASSRKGAAQAKFGAQEADQGTDDWVRGTKRPGFVAKPSSEKNPTIPKEGFSEPPQVQPRGWPDSLGDNAVDPVGGSNGKRRRPQGGFRVEYKNLGKSEERSVYDPPTLTILINLDHPLVSAALGDGNV